MIRVFAGYDARLPAGFHAFCQSLIATSSQPVSVTPLSVSMLGGLLTRPWDSKQTTPFAYSRFLVPHLCDYQGWALFVDGSDMLMNDDIAELWALRDAHYAVQVVKHPEGIHSGTKRKFFDQTQEDYPRKNWSSVMLFNCERCVDLSAADANIMNGAYLHRFEWLKDELIGELPARWNHLVGVNKPRIDPGLIHYTLGVPAFSEQRDCEWADLWYSYAGMAGPEG